MGRRFDDEAHRFGCRLEHARKPDMNVRVAVAYHSGYGKTRSLAEAVARGAASVDAVSVHLLDVTTLEPNDWQVLDRADAIISAPRRTSDPFPPR
jgi:NAD(P)H dehydrogenase (quinone)